MLPPSPAQDHDFFDTFGYLLSPGLLRDEIGWLESRLIPDNIA